METWRAHVAGNVRMFTVDLRILLEPRGFIRILQLVFAISAFSAACSYTGSSSVTVNCTTKATWTVNAAYPFRSELVDFDPPKDCAEPRTIRVPSMACGVQGKAEFFVTVGVLSLFICLVSLPVYLCKTEYYENNTWLPLLDFGVTVAMTILWFVSSCAWSDGVSSVKNHLDPKTLAGMIPACSKPLSAPADCSEAVEAKFRALNVAIILGFTNIVLWAGSSWFVYKETCLHKPREEVSISSEVPPRTPSNPVSPRASSKLPAPEASQY